MTMPSLADRYWISIAIRLADQHDPQQQVAELRAALDVGGEVAGVDVGDRRRRTPGRASPASRARARARAAGRARSGRVRVPRRAPARRAARSRPTAGDRSAGGGERVASAGDRRVTKLGTVAVGRGILPATMGCAPTGLPGWGVNGAHAVAPRGRGRARRASRAPAGRRSGARARRSSRTAAPRRAGARAPRSGRRGRCRARER